MFGEHDVIILTKDMPSKWLKKGELGTIVHIYEVNQIPAAFELEFVYDEGFTCILHTLSLNELLEYAEIYIKYS